MNDSRIVYGTQCTWWESIEKVDRGMPHGIPVCPHCKGTLFECASEEEWMKLVELYSVENAGYKAFIMWLRGKCLKTLVIAKGQYTVETGIHV